VINYTSESSTEKAQTLAATLESDYGVSAVTAQADLAHPTGPAHLVALAKNRFGDPKTGKFQLDIVINNADVGRDDLLGQITVETCQRLYAVNVLGPILLMQAALDYLPHDRSGRVVNVSSVSAVVGAAGQRRHQGRAGGHDAHLGPRAGRASDGQRRESRARGHGYVPVRIGG
jgi:NAD(P)-dependent dehydrogenase (short-subunit alcohol dehydrogenase family)